MGRIITFYSYKGGVGRTFALANIAVLLAQQGKRVLVVDWDLEAPGLHRYFHPYLPSSYKMNGLIHALHEASNSPSATWKSCVIEVRVEGYGTVSLIAAGDQSPDYVDMVRSFSWSEFFEDREGGATLESWRAAWRNDFDFTLLDSRTGITDSGGVCTILLPDILALVFTTNEQSFEQGRQVAIGVQSARRDLAVARPPVVVLPIPGRFDGRVELDDARLWLERFASDLKPFYDDWLPKQFEPRQILELTKIPYLPKFSFGEPLAVVSHGVSDPDYPGYYLEKIARLLASDFVEAAKLLAPDEEDEDAPTQVQWTDELHIFGEGFVGRREELAALDWAWAAGVRIFALHAEGGAGKTRVVVEWLRRMRDNGWRGARRVFVHSFYSQGGDERRNASSELFFEQALAFFGYSGAPITQVDEKGRVLAQLLVEHHGLLVLDGLEPLQHPTLSAERGRLKDPGLARLLLSLANVPRDERRGLCLITSRQPVMELQMREGATVVQQSLDQLHRDDGAELLRQFEIVGPDEELRKASDEFHGHAYSLMLLGSYLTNATAHHDIRRRREVMLLEEDAEHRSLAQTMFAAYVRELGEDSAEVAVLRLLGFFDRAAELPLLDVLRAREEVIYEWSEASEEADRRSHPEQHIEDSLTEVTTPLLDLPQIQWIRLLHRLGTLQLINFDGSGAASAVDSQPLLREFFAEQVRTQFPAAWRAGHRRLFEHLSGTAPYWPEGIEGLQPLYQAVVHGCLAGLHQKSFDDVYHARILRGTGAAGFYTTRKLGAIGANLGAVACFFTMPWTTVAPNLLPATQARLLNEAAFCLRALGRLSEAAEPIQIGIRIAVEREDWKNAAISSSNLGELELTRGELATAVNIGRQSVTYANRCGDASFEVTSCTLLASALHQAGRQDESRRLFQEAESRQAAWQPEYPRLYSVQGFRYSDFLLSDTERAAWRHWLGTGAGSSLILTTATAVCDMANERAAYALRIAESNRWILDIALNHLTLTRAALYRGLLANERITDHISAAVAGLRASGIVSYLPHGLLTRAWIRQLSGDEAGCRADLEEAWEIAEQGPMPLFQADIQLYRARFFRDRAALIEARRLIEKHGYHRRDGELADAEAAAERWDLFPRPPLPSHLLPGEGAPPPNAPNEDTIRDQVFISYSHRDKKLLDEFLKHMKPYLRSGAVTAWADQQIASGSQWRQEIQAALAKTRVAVLLVSPGFLASDFIHEHKLGPLLDEAKAGGVKILWVSLRSSAYQETPLKDYQAASPPDRPLAQMSKADRDEAWVRICEEIKRAVNP